MARRCDRCNKEIPRSDPMWQVSIGKYGMDEVNSTMVVPLDTYDTCLECNMVLECRLKVTFKEWLNEPIGEQLRDRTDDNA